jgi:hypothetical protein
MKMAGTFLQVERPHRVSFTRGFGDDEAAQHSFHEQVGASNGNPLPGRKHPSQRDARTRGRRYPSHAAPREPRRSL